jgi:polar amino acid transport system substrate-binding protein
MSVVPVAHPAAPTCEKFLQLHPEGRINACTPSPSSRSAALCFVALALAACGSTEAVSSAPASAANGIDVPADVAEAGELNVAVFAQYPPYSYVDESGDIVGIEIDMIEAIGEKMGVDIVWEDIPFDAIVNGVDNGRYDFSAGSFFLTPERLERVDIMDWMISSSRLIVPKGNPDDLDPSNPCGVSFANVSGGYQSTLMEKISGTCESQGKPGVTELVLPDTPSQVQAITTGRVQAILIDPAVGTYLSEEAGDAMDVLDGAVPDVVDTHAGWVFAKGNVELEKAVLQAIDQLIEEGTWENILASVNLDKLMVSPPGVNGEPLDH